MTGLSTIRLKHEYLKMNISKERKKRTFIAEDFVPTTWENIEPYYTQLLEADINNAASFRSWLRNRSELESIISENAGWRYIKMTCDTTNEEHQKAYTYFVSEIEPKIAPINHQLNEKVIKFPFKDEIDTPGFKILFRNIEKDFRIFREENIPLKTEIQNNSKEFGTISGAMTVFMDGQEMTLQQAATVLESTDRSKREEAYMKISSRRFEDKDKLDKLFNKLVGLRHQVARNAGFTNFRDYMFTAMGRFDYRPKDCFDFHASVRQEIVPILNQLARDRKSKLQLAELKPWDKAVDPTNKSPLVPFENTDDLIEKTIKCFSRLDPFLGECIQTMREIKHLDLDSRVGKAPGGYNYPLSEIGIPFIFMNATSTLRDLVTILHEGGHAVHSIVTKDLELVDFRHTPSEVAELASMSMELISMDHWNIFFENEAELKRAKKEHLEQIIQTLPWVAVIDKFQHWIYEHPNHLIEERKTKWNEILNDFSDSETDWTGLEKYKDYIWQKQLHLFEVPFYYIEYGFAQLGALAIWKNFKENPKKGLEGYLAALKLGNTRSIPQIYRAADIEFNFSREYISELISFVKTELEKV
ncbi:MAG: M3 family oligoendopeptidase [Cytophagales bacterium]|nr:M3 family oligoendopeptidase [Cytophagales bacterium]